MKRTTISLPEDLAWRLDREAKRRETSVSEVVREVLAERFDMVPGKPRKLGFVGIVKSGDKTDVASRFKEVLAETWADDIEKGWRR